MMTTDPTTISTTTSTGTLLLHCVFLSENSVTNSLKPEVGSTGQLAIIGQGNELGDSLIPSHCLNR